MVISILLLVLALGLGITAFVLGLLYLLSSLGGWGALAREYALMPEVNQGTLLEEKRQRKAWVGLVRFGGLVTARCFESGIELQMSLPFSRPLFFRWDEISEYKLVSAIPFPQAQQFTVGGRIIRLTNPLEELAKRKGRGN
jgi:hypothetical protein